MEWVTALNSTANDGKRVDLQYLKRVGDSKAEAAYRVRHGSKVVHRGWSHDSYEEYRKYTTGERP